MFHSQQDILVYGEHCFYRQNKISGPFRSVSAADTFDVILLMECFIAFPSFIYNYVKFEKIWN